MSTTQHNQLIADFFQVFVNSINTTLKKTLDADVYDKIKFALASVSKIKDAESLRNTQSIYKLDYATGNRQGALALLIPEELISAISDVVTGGTGKDSYKGSLSEIETNSSLKILEKLFKHIEEHFKKNYEHDLVFSANSVLLLKEMPEYEISSDGVNFDLLIHNTLTLREGEEYNIDILLNAVTIDNLMTDLGLDSGEIQKKNINASLDVERLSDVNINITAELGRTQVPIKYALELVRGSLIELDTINNSDIKVYANGVEFAYAQVVAVEENFGLKITKIISPKERLANL